MDEAVSNFTCLAPACQQTVLFRKQVLVVEKGAAQVLRRVVVVMQMHLDFAVSLPAQLRERIEKFGFVLLQRIEEAVPRRPAIAIREIT